MKKSILPVNVFIVFNLIFFLLMGCAKDIKEVKDPKVVEDARIKKGSYISEENGETFINSIVDKDNIEKKELVNNIITVNYDNNTYVYYKEEAYYVNYKGIDIKIETDNIIHATISPKGNKLFYFTKDEFLKPMVLDFENNKNTVINNKAVISGIYIDWISEDTLIYYGVEEETRVAGIYSLNVNSGKEELIYKIQSGYIDFLKYSNGNIFFHLINNDDGKIVYKVNSKNEIEEICQDVLSINDVIDLNGMIYFLGKVKNDLLSIYKVENGISKRVIYDYPSIVFPEKGLSKDKFENLLFIGSNIGEKEQDVYKFADGEVTLITKNSGVYDFVQGN